MEIHRENDADIVKTIHFALYVSKAISNVTVCQTALQKLE